ncbi:hypothetical protein QB607_003216 [Clostridium botulinum]|nr:hypothetical protein [Clostridium botulinum]EKS4395889.1 hypothetical protein [Clostridium botulinum]
MKNKLTLRQHTENYYFERYYYNNIEEYAQLNNITDIKLFTLYVKIEFNKHDINNLLNKINNKTALLQCKNNKDYYYIIHKSTKENKKIQCSYFKNNLAISDFIRNSYKDILKELNINNLKLKEVI